MGFCFVSWILNKASQKTECFYYWSTILLLYNVHSFLVWYKTLERSYLNGILLYTCVSIKHSVLQGVGTQMKKHIFNLVFLICINICLCGLYQLKIDWVHANTSPKNYYCSAILSINIAAHKSSELSISQLDSSNRTITELL